MAFQNSHKIIAWPGIGEIASGFNFFGGNTLDAATEYQAWAIYAHEDMAISHIGLKLNAVSGSPTADIRIETIDPTTGLPTGTLWATNTNIITGTLTTTFTMHALTATANVSKGQWVCVKVLYNSGTSLQFSFINAISEALYHYVIANTGTPTKSQGNMPAIAIGSSATSLYYVGSNFWPVTANFSANINNSNGARHGLRFQVPFKCEIIGMVAPNKVNDFDFTIYDDAGSAITGATGSFDASLSGGKAQVIFPTPFVPALNTWYRAALVPTTGSNVGILGGAVSSVDMLSGMPGGGLARRTDYTTSGGWSETNAAALPCIDLLMRRLDDGVGGGGSGASFSAFVM